jgi:hypothetical protein
MEYKFDKKKISNSTFFLIECKEKDILENLGISNWTPKEAQLIIDKVEANRTLSKTEDPYVWGNEDVTVFANEIGVLLIDKMAIRAKQEAEPLELTHDEFIDFMKDFKKFIEENS